MSSSRRYLPLATCALAIVCFYLYHLSAVGMISTDEPRYAAIGQSMARTGDLVTPYLWGSPWFEKPPLLYWMSAAFFALGAKPEVAARLPVALLSLAFLAVAAWLVRREFGEEAATVSIGLLATSAGWVAYSNLCLTDLPVSVFFALALLLALPLLRDAPDTSRLAWRFAGIGACLGMAALAKGLVPLVLAVPLAWFLRRHWLRGWPWAAGTFLLAAGPWYVAIYLRQGLLFIHEFFIKQQFTRLYSSSLQHVQPWYYYVPVLLAAIFPWTPLLLVFAGRRTVWDARRKLLLASVLFGFVFFSVSVNKLPGYLLPLLPPLLILLGAEFEAQRARPRAAKEEGDTLALSAGRLIPGPSCAFSSEDRRFADIGKKWLLAPALLIALIPVIAKGLPGALAAGKISALEFSHIGAPELFYVVAPLAAVWLGRRSWLNVLLVLCAVGGGILLKATAYPVLDQRVSARGLWREVQREKVTICDGGMNREWEYGLNFYLGHVLPACGQGGPYDRVLRAKGRGRPVLEKSKTAEPGNGH